LVDLLLPFELKASYEAYAEVDPLFPFITFVIQTLQGNPAILVMYIYMYVYTRGRRHV
jgi:hypothetical protein